MATMLRKITPRIAPPQVAPPAPKREQANALEFTTGDKPLRVDREKGVIYNVHVLGVESKNRRTYPLPVQAKARPLYEGVSVNISHPPRENAADDRPFETLFGALRGANTEDGTRADLHFIKSHPLAEMVCEAAERFPENFGLSHNAHVDWLVKDDGHRVCESINSVRSVDVVCRPATTNGIFESEQPMDPTQDTALQPAGGNGTDAAPPADNGGSDDDPHCQMFLDGAKKIFVGEGDVADKVKRIAQLAKTILGNEDAIDTAINGDKPAAGDDDDDVPGAQESVKEKRRKLDSELATVRQKLAGFERREKARDALEAAKVEATGARITSVAALESESDRKALIEEFAKVDATKSAETPANKPKPKSVPANTLESQQSKPDDALPNGLKPLTREQLAASVHSAGRW
jgi:hypothetical protein